VDTNTVLCRLYYRDAANVEEASELLEGAFRIASSPPEERELILEVVS
jgi:hexokinase